MSPGHAFSHPDDDDSIREICHIGGTIGPKFCKFRFFLHFLRFLVLSGGNIFDFGEVLSDFMPVYMERSNSKAGVLARPGLPYIATYCKLVFAQDKNSPAYSIAFTA